MQRFPMRRWGLAAALFLLILPSGTGAADFLAQEACRACHARLPAPGSLEAFDLAAHLTDAMPESERLPRYSMAYAFRTYMDSFHGRLRALGQWNAPTCSNCHGADWLHPLSPEDPASPVHASNLPRTCASSGCHDARLLASRVAEGSMHLDVSGRHLVLAPARAGKAALLPSQTYREASYRLGEYDVPGVVNTFFIFLTMGVLTVFTLVVVLDAATRIRKRRRQEASDDREG